MKKARLFLISALAVTTIGGALARTSSKSLQGNLLICVGGVCEASNYSDNDEEGGLEQEPQLQFYKGNVGFRCNTSNCTKAYPTQVWFHD